MDWDPKIAIAATAIAIVLSGAPARAEGDWTERVQLLASVGYEYDDNVNDPNVDQAADQGASAGIFEAGIALDLIEDDQYELDAGYDYFESIYAEDDVDELDLRLHTPWVMLTRRFREVDVDFEWRSSFGELGERRYLDTHALGPTIGTLIGESVYLSAGYGYEYRNARRAHPLVTATNDRTAHRNSLRADALLLLPDHGLRLGFGAFFRDENATKVALFDYQGVGVRANLAWRTPVPGIGYGSPELSVRVHYEERRYDRASRARTLAGPRRDERTSVTVALELPIHHYLFARLTYDYLGADSNDPSADYDSNVARLQLEARY